MTIGIDGSRPKPQVQRTAEAKPAAPTIAAALEAPSIQKPPDSAFDALRKKLMSVSGGYRSPAADLNAETFNVKDLLGGQVQARAAGKSTKSKLVGTTLLTKNFNGDPVKVKKELSPPEGYNSRYQAIAAARMTGSDAAYVIEKNGKWHAVEGDKPIGTGKTTEGSENGLGHVEGLPPYDETKIAALQTKLAATTDRKELQKLRLEIASEMFGVPPEEINFIGRSEDRKEGKINIIDLPTGTAGRHGPENDHDEEFTPGVKTAVEIDVDTLSANPTSNPLGVLFHESSHQHDYELAQSWVGKYEKATGKKFQPSENGDPLFTTWLDKQASGKKPKLNKADQMIITDATRRGVNGNTEARAYLGSFISALQVGSPAAAKDQLVTWAKNQPSPIPVPSLQLENQMFSEMEKAYRNMTPDQQKAFDAALKDAKAAKSGVSPNPLARFDHKTALKLPY